MGNCLFLRKGETHTAPVSGILASEIAVGSTVKLMENGVAAEYLVVHQGLPSSMYDTSCDGTWLLRKDCYEERQWHSSNNSRYAQSTIHNYLNSTFLGMFDNDVQSQIKNVKIPYAPYSDGSGSANVSYGSNGLSVKIFLLSGYEVGWTQHTRPFFPIDGSCLSYFSGTSAVDIKRISKLNGSETMWWLRSLSTNYTGFVFCVTTSGYYEEIACYYDSRGFYTNYGVRPALILPSTALFDKNTLILKGVA